MKQQQEAQGALNELQNIVSNLTAVRYLLQAIENTGEAANQVAAAANDNGPGQQVQAMIANQVAQ